MNRRDRFRRNVGVRPLRKRFLIVCEGERTEPLYFKGFRTNRIVLSIEGAGANTVSLVRKTVQLMSKSEFDEVWCVFDKDDFSASNVNTALQLAAKYGIRVAYSNQCFEYWYILHFQHHTTASHRDDYKQLLSKRLGQPYKKNASDMYALLRDRQAAAIRRAKQIHQSYRPARPIQDDPCTTVYELVEELNRHLV